MRHQRVRINIQLDAGLKGMIAEVARQRGESVSEFFRQGAEERLVRMRREEQEQRLAEACGVLASEHSDTAQHWEAVDLEGWET